MGNRKLLKSREIIPVRGKKNNFSQIIGDWTALACLGKK